MNKFILVLTGLITSSAFAVVPTTDMYQMGQDTSTTASYVAQIPTYLSKMNSTMNAANQVQNLHGLAQIQGGGQAICELCNASDLATMQSYVNSINTDLCGQFSAALSNITGTQQSISSLQGVMAAFTSNPKAAALALQQASVATQSATQNTMAQMQMLEAQTQQRQLAQQKLEQTSTTDAMSNGFHSGL